MAERFEPATPPKRPTMNERQIAIALQKKNQGFCQYLVIMINNRLSFDLPQ